MEEIYTTRPLIRLHLEISNTVLQIIMIRTRIL